MLEHLAKSCPLTEDAKSCCNDYAAPQLSIADCANKAETRIAHQFFDQIQGAEDGSLVVHHARGKRVPSAD